MIVAKMEMALWEPSITVDPMEYKLVMENLERIPMRRKQCYIESAVEKLNQSIEIILPQTNRNNGDVIEGFLGLPSNPFKEHGDLLGMELKSWNIVKSAPIRLTTKNFASGLLEFMSRRDSRYHTNPHCYEDVIYYPSCPAHNALNTPHARESHTPPLLAVTSHSYTNKSLDGILDRLMFDLDGDTLRMRIRPNYSRIRRTGGAYLTRNASQLRYSFEEMFAKLRNGFLLVVYKEFSSPIRGLQIQRVIYCHYGLEDFKRLFRIGELSINMKLKGRNNPKSPNQSFDWEIGDIKRRMHHGDGFQSTSNWRCPELS